MSETPLSCQQILSFGLRVVTGTALHSICPPSAVKLPTISCCKRKPIDSAILTTTPQNCYFKISLPGKVCNQHPIPKSHPFFILSLRYTLSEPCLPLSLQWIKGESWKRELYTPLGNRMYVSCIIFLKSWKFNGLFWGLYQNVSDSK